LENAPLSLRLFAILHLELGQVVLIFLQEEVESEKRTFIGLTSEKYFATKFGENLLTKHEA
jgi:hypothetical protein